MFKKMEKTLTFDDVLLVPQYSQILPHETILKTQLTANVSLNFPIISAAMDTVTEHKMAIALALAGGIGIIHKNLSIQEQVEEVKLVKRFENGFIEKPVTISPQDKIKKVVQIRNKLGYKKIPVINTYGKLVGLIREIDYMSPFDDNQLVSDRMIPIDKMIVARYGIDLEKANTMIRKYRLKTLCLIDEKGQLKNIVTRRDIEKNEKYPLACKNSNKQLRVGAAISVGEESWKRAMELIKTKVDVITIDTAHGHSRAVIDMVKRIKQQFPRQQIIAGNIASAEAAKDLILAGADAVKVGIGPGSICTTRIVSGIGVPQLSAIKEVVKLTRRLSKKIPIIADGGIKNSGDIVKALAAGADTVMVGNLLAGTDEAPGKLQFINGNMYKTYRGMGSIEAMERGSKDRYGQANVEQKNKLVPEGVSGRVNYKGKVDQILYQMAGGLRSGMGYCGSKTINELHNRARFIQVSAASLKENHPHDLKQIEASPNYNQG